MSLDPGFVPVLFICRVVPLLVARMGRYVAPEEDIPAYTPVWPISDAIAKQIANRTFRHKIDDNHVASIQTFLVTEAEANRPRSNHVNAFQGHEWMIGSLMTRGEITEQFRT